MKNSLCNLFCTQNEKTFGRKRSRDSVTGVPIFANLVSKYPQDFKEKSHEAARLKALRFCARGKIYLGGGGPPRPPSAVRVKFLFYVTQF